MIPGHEGCGEGASLQPVQTLVITLIAVPHTAEVSCYQNDVLFCEALLLIEDSRLEALEISVEVSRNINFHGVFSYYFLIALSISISVYLNLMRIVSASTTVILSTYLRVMVSSYSVNSDFCWFSHFASSISLAS